MTKTKNWSCFQCNFEGTKKQVENHKCGEKKAKKSDSDKFYEIIENMVDEDFAEFAMKFFGEEEVYERIRNVVGIGDKAMDKQALELARSVSIIK